MNPCRPTPSRIRLAMGAKSPTMVAPPPTPTQGFALNYRHHFHAGNFADLMKHALWMALLRQLTRKTAPLQVLDTHAGAGI